MWEIEVFYDGECPLCMREIRMLQRLDRDGGRIRFTDISRPEHAGGIAGLDFDTLMAEIHGRLPDGTLITGVEVFRRLYAAVGFRRTVAVTRLPGLRHVLDLAYRLFARNRLRLTGRCAPDGTCRVPARG